MWSINPATGERLREYPEHDAATVDALLGGAGAAFERFRRTPLVERLALLRNLARVLNERRAEYARVMTLEMGKPIGAAESEVDKCAKVCEYYAEHAAELLEPERVETEARASYVRYDPLGPVLAIMPWNFPFWQVFRFAAPAVACGNTALLKHAANVTGCSLAIEEAFRHAGAPDGVFRSLLLKSSDVGRVIEDPRVAAVTLTGSEAAGRAVARTAGACLKKVVLELGGSDPFVVLADADVEQAARVAVQARLINAGQSCIAAKRFIVEEKVAPAFEAAFVRALERVRVGDPADRATDVGPLAREDLVDSLEDQVQRSVAAGAELLAGGKRLSGRGYFYAPTALSGVRPGMPAFDEETFGPVAAIVRARDAAHAVEFANQSRFGLGASIWTRDQQVGERWAGELQAGMVFVNGMVQSDPRLPFGGIKASGHGRELGVYGVREFVNVKTVWVD